MPLLGASPQRIREAGSRPAPSLAPPRQQVPNYVEVHAPRPVVHPTAPVRMGTFHGGIPHQPFMPAPQRQALPQRQGGTPVAALRGLRGALNAPEARLAGIAGQRVGQPEEREELGREQAIERALRQHFPGAGPLPITMATGRILPRQLNAERVQREAIERARQRQASGVGGPLDLGFVNITPIVRTLATMKLPGIGGIPGKLANELIDLPGQTFLSGAMAGAAGRRALEGKPKELGGVAHGILSQLEHPLRSAEEAPLATGLTLLGGEYAAARAAGALGRGLGGEGLKAALATERPDLQLYGATPEGAIAKEQAYSPDPLRKAIQVGYEKALTKLPEPLRQQDPFMAEGWRLQKNLVGGRVRPGRLDRERAALEQARRQLVKQKVIPEATAALHTEGKFRTKPIVGQDAVPLFHTAEVRPVPALVEGDLRKNLARLQDVQPTLKGKELKANKESVRQYEGLLADKKFLAHPEEAINAAIHGTVQQQKPLTALEIHHGTLSAEQAARAPLMTYALAHMDARPGTGEFASGEGGSGLQKPNGDALTNGEIEAHMLAHGVDPRNVGFITHQPGVSGRGSFYKALIRPPKPHSFTRTGAAFLKGTHDTSTAGLVGQLADQASRVAQAEGWAAPITRYGIGEGDRAWADRAAQNFNHPESVAPGAREARQLGGMVVVSKGTGKVMEAGQLETPRDPAAELARLGLAEHTPASMVKPGKYTLVPRDIMQRLQKGAEASSARTDWKRFAQAYTQAFRHVKFATSPKHFAGIIEENLIRPIMENAGPISYLAGRRFRRGLALNAQTSPEGHINEAFGPEGTQARQLQGTFAGRGQITGMKGTDIVRKPEAMIGRDFLTKGAEKAGRSIPMKAWLTYRNGTERALRSLEHVSQTAQLGKVLQRTGFANTWKAAFRTTDQAMADEIKGRMTPNKADQVARALNNAAGNWNALTPGVQAAVSTITPFGLWWVNSMRWLSHLPLEHPLKTAVISSVYNATRGQRNELGQGYQAEGVGTREHPNYLQGTIPIKLPLFGRGLLDLGHYSPFGVGGPEAPGTAAEMVGPQFEGPIAAALGINPVTKEKLKQQSGAELTGGQKTANVIAEALAGPTAGATQAQQLLQSGGKPYGTANLITDLLEKLGGSEQVKPGTRTPVANTFLKLLQPLKVYKVPGSQGGSLSEELAAERQQILQGQHAGHAAQEQELRNERRQILSELAKRP